MLLSLVSLSTVNAAPAAARKQQAAECYDQGAELQKLPPSLQPVPGPCAKDADSLRIARAYEHGIGVPRSDLLAAQWYGRVNSNESLAWLREAAQRGNTAAQHELYNLLSLRQDPALEPEAIALEQKAAASGYPPAILMYALLLEDGSRVPRDVALARTMALQAAAHGPALKEVHAAFSLLVAIELAAPAPNRLQACYFAQLSHRFTPRYLHSDPAEICSPLKARERAEVTALARQWKAGTPLWTAP
ncbi:MAG: hypothetical protein RLZZ618_1203 [Pseudomonadota bacterium]|jgi:TPR repeat protein